jgi:hypothetical protein
MIYETDATEEMKKKPIVWKCEKPYSVTNAVHRVHFPKLFYLQCGLSEPRRLCLCSTEHLYKDEEGFLYLTFYRFNVIENPENFFSSFTEYEDKEEAWMKPYDFYIDREATSAYPRTIYNVKVLKEGKYLQSPVYGRVYCLVFYNCWNPDCYPLPWKVYTNIMRANDKKEYYFIIKKEEEKKKEKELIVYKIPEFALKLMLEGVVAKKEICPITTDMLTNQNACITACGHSFEYGALCKALETKKICPSCRTECKKESIVRL